MANLRKIIEHEQNFVKPKVSTLQKGNLILVRIEDEQSISHYALSRGDVALYLNEMIGFSEVESQDLSFEIFELLPISKADIVLICQHAGEVIFDEPCLNDLLKNLPNSKIEIIAKIIASENYKDLFGDFLDDKVNEVYQILMEEVTKALYNS